MGKTFPTDQHDHHAGAGANDQSLPTSQRAIIDVPLRRTDTHSSTPARLDPRRRGADVGHLCEDHSRPTNMATTPVPEQMTMHSVSELLGGIRDRQGRANPLQIDMEMLGGV